MDLRRLVHGMKHPLNIYKLLIFFHRALHNMAHLSIAYRSVGHSFSGRRLIVLPLDE